MAAHPVPAVATVRTVPETFQSLEILFRRQDATYWAEIIGSPVGAKSGVEIDARRLEDDDPTSSTAEPQGSGGVRRRTSNPRRLRHQGERLFKTLFTGQVAEVFRATVVKVRAEKQGLQIRLLFDDAPELARLPWEAMWDPETRAFLADQADLPIIRAMRQTPTDIPQRVEEPMRLVALLPEPKKRAKLSGEAEWRHIETALQDWVDQGRVTTHRLETQTLDSLKRCFDAGRCDVLHVVAHGGAGETGEGGVLKLEDAFGEEKKVTGLELARIMERRTKPRLVLLNACHGGRTASHDALDGMAQHLIRRGVMAVIAMRRSITDDAARAFAQSFYGELAKGVCVEAAMVEARRTLAAGKHRTEWAIPALYLRGQTIQILPKPKPSLALRYSDWRIQTLKATPKNRSAWLFLIPLLICLGWLARPFFAPGDLQDTPPSTAMGLAAFPDGGSDGDSSQAQTSPNCPPPLGLEDLRFVEIQPDVQSLGDVKLVITDAFCIGTKEVSRRDWFRVMGGENSQPDWPLDWPMTGVTFRQAQEFTEKLSLREPGVRYRLPTATEWEFAARAGSQHRFSFGDDKSQLDQHANCFNWLGSDHFDGPAPISSFGPNAWGLYDVHGNVAEWVEQDMEATRTSEPSESDALDEGQALRLGGSFRNKPSACQFGGLSPVKAEAEDREGTGLRVVRDLAEE